MSLRTRLRHILQLRFLQHLTTAGTILVIILLTLVISGSLLLLGPTMLDLLALDEAELAGLEALAAVAALAFGAGAGLLVLMEITEANDIRNLSIYQDIYENLKTPEELAARRLIYMHMPDLHAMEDAARVAAIRAMLRDDAEMRHAIKTVLNTFDYFGFLMQQDWVTADDIIGWLSPIVVKLWHRIGPLVEYERAMRPAEPDYYRSAFYLVKKCQQWRDKNLPHRHREIAYDEERL